MTLVPGSLPFAPPRSTLQLRRLGHRMVLAGLLVLVVGLGIPLGVAALFGLSNFLILLSTLVGYFVLPVVLFMLIAGLTAPSLPVDPSWKRVLLRYRARAGLMADREYGPADFAGLDDEDLNVAARLPDHHARARAAAQLEAAARGAPPNAEIPLIPNFVPPHPPGSTLPLVVTKSELLRRWSLPAMYAGAAIAVVTVLAALGMNAAGALTDDWFLVVLFAASSIVVAVATVLLFLSSVLRRRPARLLFLRKFNSRDLSHSYQKLTRRELKPFGHVLGLSDRFMGDSWVKWFFRSGFVLGRLNPEHYLLKIILLPFVAVLRRFDRVRFGPPLIADADNYRRLCAHLAQRRWISFRSRYMTNGLFVRTSDDWWQIVALTTLWSSDLVVFDLSEATEGVEWEISTISELDLWHRVVVICREDRLAAVEARADLHLFGPIWTYDENGRFKDRAGFQGSAAAAIHASVEWRWSASTKPASATSPAVFESQRRRRRTLLGLSLGFGGIVVLLLIAFLFRGSGLFGDGEQAGGPDRNTVEACRSNPDTGFACHAFERTNEVWAQLYEEQADTFALPRLILYSRAGQSRCGAVQSALGPYYCPLDQGIYIDTEFLSELSRRLGSRGDHAVAYVMAHEIGHHVQYMSGIGDRVRNAQRGGGEAEAIALQVRLELQADCLAGMAAAQPWLGAFNLEEGQRLAAMIGRDTLQRSAGRRPAPESFNHGTAAQREEAFRRGRTGRTPELCVEQG